MASRRPPDSPRYESLRASRRTLARIAPVVRFGLVSVGCSMFLEHARGLIDDTQFTWGERRIMAIVGASYLVGFGLAAWVAGKLIATGAELIDVAVDQAEDAHRTTDLIERHAVPTLGRIALALENLAIPANQPTAAPPPPPPDDSKVRAQAVARRSIADGRWPQAEKLVAGFVRDYPGLDAARLIAELDVARQVAVDDLRDQLDDAKAARDASKAIDLRDALTLHLRGSDLARFDDELAVWLVDLIRSRARSETIRPELAELAARVADTFADTPSGAALAPSIPNLRRSAARSAPGPSFTPSTTQADPLEGE